MNEDLHFLELSLPVADIRQSLGWYLELGLAELITNDVRQHHYAVVGNSEVAIGLHDGNMAAPGLTFVQLNMARNIRNRLDRGEEFIKAELGIDAFHEAVQSDPDGTLATIIEARTFSPGHRDDGLTGRLHSLTIPCMRINDSVEFWQRYGFIAVESTDAGCAELHAPGLIIELRAGTRDFIWRFEPADYDAVVADLNGKLELRMFTDQNNKGVELIAPEGTRIQLVRS